MQSFPKNDQSWVAEIRSDHDIWEDHSEEFGLEFEQVNERPHPAGGLQPRAL